MELVAIRTVPAEGDYVRVGSKTYRVASFDASTRRIWYILDYAHRRTPVSVSYTGYSLLDGPSARPRVWKRVGDRFRFLLKFKLRGREVQWERMAVSRAAAKAHVLHAVGQTVLQSGLIPAAYTAKGKTLIAEANGKSQYDESMIEVVLN